MARPKHVNHKRALEVFRNYGGILRTSEAIREGVRVRLRPIVLTTLTTTLGLMPMALGIPSYSLVWGAMASTFVSGLATATFLTLFIVPVEWDLLMELKERWGGSRERDSSGEAGNVAGHREASGLNRARDPV